VACVFAVDVAGVVFLVDVAGLTWRHLPFPPSFILLSCPVVDGRDVAVDGACRRA